MKIVAISDTHGKHKDLEIPDGDVLIHAGDLSMSGTKIQVTDFLKWFAQQPIRDKIFIPGNHDFFFEQADPKEINAIIPAEVIYLNDSGVELNGVKFWGSPITPWFNNWAFNRNRGVEIKRHWDSIPENTKVLITHGPPFGLCDETVYGKHVGCEDLLKRVHQIRPKYHISGHIHEGYGHVENGLTRFVNCSVLDERYRLKNPPYILRV